MSQNPNQPAPTIKRLPPVSRALGVDPASFPIIQILDIGAMAEGADRYAPLLEQELASVVGFEPNRAQLALLLEARLPRKRYLPYFLGKGGPATFYLTEYAGCASLFEPDPAIIDLFLSIGTVPTANFHVVKKLPVETTRLDDVPGLPAADYLKLDIQGGELDVLQNATRTLASALVLEIEAEFIPLYKNQPLFGDIQSFLRTQGFLLHKFIDIGGRALRPLRLGENPFEPISQILFADAIFVRDFSTLGTWSDDQLLKAAAILYEPYRSHDLVHRLLAEYDRRRRSAHAAAFIQTLASLGPIQTFYLNQKLHA
jgi:FkbM family methyltransferase